MAAEFHDITLTELRNFTHRTLSQSEDSEQNARSSTGDWSNSRDRPSGRVTASSSTVLSAAQSGGQAVQLDSSDDLLSACSGQVLYSSAVSLDEPGNIPNSRPLSGSCFQAWSKRSLPPGLSTRSVIGRLSIEVRLSFSTRHQWHSETNTVRGSSR